jgi:ABC-type siderophore export system fused ATPase/permease subunit
VLVVSHDERLRAVADRVHVLTDGRLVDRRDEAHAAGRRTALGTAP